MQIYCDCRDCLVIIYITSMVCIVLIITLKIITMQAKKSKKSHLFLYYFTIIHWIVYLEIWLSIFIGEYFSIFNFFSRRSFGLWHINNFRSITTIFFVDFEFSWYFMVSLFNSLHKIYLLEYANDHLGTSV